MPQYRPRNNIRKVSRLYADADACWTLLSLAESSSLIRMRSPIADFKRSDSATMALHPAQFDSGHMADQLSVIRLWASTHKSNLLEKGASEIIIRRT